MLEWLGVDVEAREKITDKGELSGEESDADVAEIRKKRKKTTFREKRVG